MLKPGANASGFLFRSHLGLVFGIGNNALNLGAKKLKTYS